MPNWVWNTITVRKEDEHYLVNADGNVDFNVLKPMPKAFEDTIDGAEVRDCTYFYILTMYGKDYFIHTPFGQRALMSKLFDEDMSKEEMISKLKERISDNPLMYDDEEYNKPHNHTAMEIGEYYFDLYKEYGVSNWYEWRCRYWGTKWNASDTNRYEDGDLVKLSFDTPWCTPFGWLDTLATKIKYHLAWEEEQGFRGIVLSDGEGGITDEQLEDLTLEVDEETGEYYQKDTQFEEDEYWGDYMLDEVF